MATQPEDVIAYSWQKSVDPSQREAPQAPRSSLALSHTFNGRVCLYPALAALEGAERDR